MKCPTCGSEQWKRGTTPHVEEVDGRKFKADLAAQVSPETVSRWENGGRAAALSAVATLGAMVLDHAAGSTMTADRLQALRKGPRLAKVVRLDLRAGARR